jgi:hypothetical protein
MEGGMESLYVQTEAGKFVKVQDMKPKDKHLVHVNLYWRVGADGIFCLRQYRGKKGLERIWKKAFVGPRDLPKA